MCLDSLKLVQVMEKKNFPDFSADTGWEPCTEWAVRWLTCLLSCGDPSGVSQTYKMVDGTLQQAENYKLTSTLLIKATNNCC